MHGRTWITMGLAGALGLAGCAKQAPAPPAPTMTSDVSSTAKGGSREHEVTITATVEKVNVKERLVTLRGHDGELKTIHVGDEVRNLPQMRRGDHVVVTYSESVAFQVLKPGEAKPGISGAVEAARAQPGTKPGGAVAEVVTVVATIVKLDRKAQQATLRGPEGKTVVVDVQNPENFNKVKVGDTVEITYTEELAIDVQPAPKR